MVGVYVPAPTRANGSLPELAPPNAACPVTGAFGSAVPTPIRPVVGTSVVVAGVFTVNDELSVVPVAGS